MAFSTYLASPPLLENRRVKRLKNGLLRVVVDTFFQTDLRKLPCVVGVVPLECKNCFSVTSKIMETTTELINNAMTFGTYLYNNLFLSQVKVHIVKMKNSSQTFSHFLPGVLQYLPHSFLPSIMAQRPFPLFDHRK